MKFKKQQKTPLFDALKKYVEDRTVSFHMLVIKAAKAYRNFAVLLVKMYCQSMLLLVF